jgi:uncharacterized protein YjbI with pentapeptide repeats
MTGANLTAVRGSAADFTGADLGRALLREAQLPSAFFEGTILAEADLRKSDLSKGIFARCRAVGAVFDECLLTYADFAYALLDSASFRDADLTHAKLHAVRDRDTIWDGAVLKHVERTDKDRGEAESWKPPD